MSVLALLVVSAISWGSSKKEVKVAASPSPQLVAVTLEHTNPSMGPHEKIITYRLDLRADPETARKFLDETRVNDVVTLAEYVEAQRAANTELLDKVRAGASPRALPDGGTISRLLLSFDEGRSVDVRDLRRWILSGYYRDVLQKRLLEEGTKSVTSRHAKSPVPKPSAVPNNEGVPLERRMKKSALTKLVWRKSHLESSRDSNSTIEELRLDQGISEMKISWTGARGRPSPPSSRHHLDEAALTALAERLDALALTESKSEDDPSRDKSGPPLGAPSQMRVEYRLELDYERGGKPVSIKINQVFHGPHHKRTFEERELARKLLEFGFELKKSFLEGRPIPPGA